MAGSDLLAGPIALRRRDGRRQSIGWAAASRSSSKQAAGVVAWQSQDTAGPLTVECRANMEFDGHLGFTLTCQAAKTVEVNDIRLELPVRREARPYFMGIGHKGGLRPKDP